MTRSMTAAGTAALCAILMVTVQISTSAQTKTPAKAAAPAKAAPAKPAPAKAAAPEAEPKDSVTLTGCLQADGSKYMLRDLEGTQAPKGRSWKTGFITKKAKDVEVTGASSTLKLSDYRGHKVSVVGVKDGETHMKARSIKQLAKSCS